MAFDTNMIKIWARGRSWNRKETYHMRCVACDHNSKKKDQKVEDLCPKCGHRFALDLKVDGIADGFMKQAVDAVSSNGTFKYLPAQLDYEVWRRSQPPTTEQRLLLSLILLAVLVAGGLVLFLMADSDNPLFFLTFLLIFFSLAGVYKASPVSNSRPRNPKSALRRYEAINPPTDKLGPGPYRPDRGRETKLQESPSDERGDAALVEIETGSEPAMFSHKAAFDRLLVCEYPEYRDFYIANDFHLHHACHVMGPDDIETEDGRALLDQLKQKPELDVFVVHDATPRGVKFVDEVQSDRRWLGGHAAAAVLDLGLLPDQFHLFETMIRPLAPEEMEGIDEAVKGLPANMGADLSVIPAGPLMSVTGASVDERLTFDRNSYTERRREDKRRESEDGWWFHVGGDGE